MSQKRSATSTIIILILGRSIVWKNIGGYGKTRKDAARIIT